MLVGLNPISTLGLNLRNGLSEQNSEVTTGKEIIFYVDPPGVEFTKNYSSPSYRAAKILSRVGSTPDRPHVRRNFFPIRFTWYMFQCLIPEVPPRGDVKSFKFATHPCKHLLLKPSQTMYRCTFNENLARGILGSTRGRPRGRPQNLSCQIFIKCASVHGLAKFQKQMFTWMGGKFEALYIPPGWNFWN